MSVRKRKWTTRKGEEKETWIVDYIDQQGARHIQTFARKKEADEYHATVRVDVRQGVHTPAAKGITVAEAAEDWLKFVELEGRERSTVTAYRQQVAHINKRIGREKLAKLTTPRINVFRDDLLASMTRANAAKVLTSLKMLLKDAKRRGNVAQNVALDVSISADKRKAKLKVGVDIPTPDEIRSIVHAATGKHRPFLLTAIFTGLRSSELRGLRWQDVDLKRGELHVRQRADRYKVIGKLKSASGERTVPLGPLVLNALKEWKLACPKGDLGLVFPNGVGRVEDHANLIVRVLQLALIKAGVTIRAKDAQGRPVVDKEGKPVVEAKYTGLHALRHFYASWCINRKQDGGLELPIKTVQARLGHASILMTSDRYGHLFPSGDDGGELAAAERVLLA